jgi:Tat protein translocase TatB subunit
MFNIGFGELVVIFIVAIIFIKPEEFPKILKRIGRLIGYLRATYDSFIDTLTEKERLLQKFYDAHIPKEYKIQFKKKSKIK